MPQLNLNFFPSLAVELIRQEWKIPQTRFVKLKILWLLMHCWWMEMAHYVLSINFLF
jgi:hypothetical protein